MKLIIYIAAAALSGCAGSPLHNAVNGNGFVCTMDNCLSPAQQHDARLVIDNSPSRLSDQLTHVASAAYEGHCLGQDVKVEAVRYNVVASDQDWRIIGTQLHSKIRLLCKHDNRRKTKFVDDCTATLNNQIELIQSTQRKHNVRMTPTSMLLTQTYGCHVLNLF